jgi:hypothetical protein
MVLGPLGPAFTTETVPRQTAAAAVEGGVSPTACLQRGEALRAELLLVERVGEPHVGYGGEETQQRGSGHRREEQRGSKYIDVS